VVNLGDGSLVVTPQEVASVKATGAGLVRIDFSLPAGTTNWTPTLLATYGQAITMFQDAGIGVLGLVSFGATGDSTQTDWQANNHENTGGSGDNPFLNTAYTAALRTLVEAFHAPPYNVKLWEIWNEPNAYQSCSPVCSGLSYIYPSNFAALLADSYLAIKGGSSPISDVTLISGGLFGHSIIANGGYTSSNSGADYLAATYCMGTGVGSCTGAPGLWNAVKQQTGSYPLDAVGQHIYVDQNTYSTPATIHAYLDWVRNAYTAVEGVNTPKRTIVTEGGWATGPGGVTQNQQALNVDALFWAAKDAGYVSTVTWFQWQDVTGASPQLFFGLYDSSGAAKPSLAHYQAQ
jgi:hypothetical protein